MCYRLQQGMGRASKEDVSLCITDTQNGKTGRDFHTGLSRFMPASGSVLTATEPYSSKWLK